MKSTSCWTLYAINYDARSVQYQILKKIVLIPDVKYLIFV